MRSKQEGLPGKTKRSKGKRTRVAIFIALVVLVIAGIASIALPRKSTHAQPKKYKATKEIILDQATGTLRKPTPEETDLMVAQISSLTNRSTAGLPTSQAANGTQMMDLQERFSGVVLGRATADGGTEVRCVFTLEEAADFLGLEADQ
jgi:flagellar basal body-associated protein FliL